ncbi:hypothetical protein [Streptomyces sp. 5-10]|uniref:hypothetical protein n=1 Tax=Streptomyces sp. 5-10 TaxID=878925 RepID=UPI001CC2977B|nr:hypothetical protein [Streptomyces sp. 5-10]
MTGDGGGSGAAGPADRSPSGTARRIDTGLAAYNRTLEPKRLVTIPGGHFAPYTTEFARASAAATAFFRDHPAPDGD